MIAAARGPGGAIFFLARGRGLVDHFLTLGPGQLTTGGGENLG